MIRDSSMERFFVNCEGMRIILENNLGNNPCTDERMNLAQALRNFNAS